MRVLLATALALAFSACTCGPSQTSRTRPEIDVNPTSVDFGTVAPGASASRSVTITSRGTTPVTISDLSVQGDATFSTSASPRTLAPGETYEVQVTWAAPAGGPHAARLVVTSDAVNAPELLIPLAGDASASCTPTTCAAEGKDCGTISDGCGGQLSCGTCAGNATCGGGGLANVCGCAESDAAFCARLGKTCGLVTDTDACGIARTASCGTCALPRTCQATNVCACAESDAAFCARLGKDCGSVSGTDVCGVARTASCGSCTAPNTCGGTNVCACSETDAAFCTRLGKDCGSVSGTDVCGAARTANCGSCASPQTCGANNVCACDAETNQAFCARLGASCGTITNADNCGAQRTVDCGPCGTCSAPGTIPPLGHVVSGTTSGSSTMSSTCGGGGAPEQVWTYTPQVSGSVTISSCGSSFDTVVSVLQNACPGGSQVTCDDNTSIWCPNGTTHSYVTWNATAGQTYYVVVDGAGSGQGWYNLRVSPPDGTCANPIQVPSNGGTQHVGMAGNSTDSASCGGSGGDKVHHWVAPRSGTATVTMVPDFWPSTLYVRQGSCHGGAELACDNKTAQWPTNTISFPVTAGTEYFIWASYGTYNGPVVSIYDLTVSLP